MKDARSEAAKEIEAYKAKKEEDFKKFKSEVSRWSVAWRLREDREEPMKAIQVFFSFCCSARLHHRCVGLADHVLVNLVYYATLFVPFIFRPSSSSAHHTLGCSALVESFAPISSINQSSLIDIPIAATPPDALISGLTSAYDRSPGWYYGPTRWTSLSLLLYRPLHRRCSQHKSETSSSQSAVDSDTKKQLSELDSAVAKNRDEVIKKIVERVVKCEPKLHPNLKKIEA